MITIDRLRVRCRTADREVADGLTRRLVGIAQHLLPEALDARLGSSAGISEQLRVRLDFDPRDYDDATVAALWADRIARAFTRTSPSADRTDDRSAASVVGEMMDGEPGVAASSNVVNEPGRDAEATPVDDALRLIPLAGSPDPDGVRHLGGLTEAEARVSWLQRVATIGGSDLWDDLISVAEGSLGLPLAMLDFSSAARLISEHEAAWQAVVEAFGAGPATDVSVTAPCRPDSPRPVRAAGRMVPEETSPPPADAAVPAKSRVGGIVLFYPWLRNALEDVTERFGVDPPAARLVALVELSGDVTATGDPLLGVLAGADAGLPAVEIGLDGRTWLEQWAEHLYGRLAGDLRGFETSSRIYLQRELIERHAVMTLADEAVHLRLAPRPLDLALTRYPYPRSSFRLPWTPPLHLTWETS